MLSFSVKQYVIVFSKTKAMFRELTQNTFEYTLYTPGEWD